MRFIASFDPRSVAAALALLALSPVSAGTPGDADAWALRYAEFDKYVPEREGEWIVDLDMGAIFAGGGSDVVFHKGPKRSGEVRLASPQTQSSRVLVGDGALRASLAAAGAFSDRNEAVGVQDYLGKSGALIVSVGDKRWRYDLASGKASREPDARVQGVLSPDGKFRVISRDFNLVLVDTGSGREVPLTSDGSHDRRYGINYPRLGYQVKAGMESPPMTVEAYWSQDSSTLLTHRLDRNQATLHEGVQPRPPGGGGPKRFRYVYPTAGTAKLPLFRPLLIDVASRTTKLLDVPAQELLFPISPSLSWQGGRVHYQWTRRGYGELKLIEVDPASGKAVTRIREAMQPNVTATATSIRSAPALGGALLISERSGWAQLYLIRNGDPVEGGRRLTQGAWEVSEVLHVSDDDVLVSGVGRETGVNPYFRMLYRVGLDGSIVNLTPEPLDHRVTVSEDGRWFIDRMSSPTQPTRTLLRSTADGRIAMELGRADPSAMTASGFTPPEVFETLAGDGKTTLYAMIYRPSRFDPSRRYPVIDHLYTGPNTHRFRENYERNVSGMATALAQLGAVVVTIDARGTSQRGRAFRLPSYRNLTGVGIEDHVRVLRAMRDKYPYLDLDRVGVIGGSAGGYDAFRFMAHRPDVFKVGVSQSGNHDLRLDKAWWPEAWMGLADDADWTRNSNLTYADKLQGKLLLVHGDIDDNVPLESTLALSRALDRAGKAHETVVLPNVGHQITGPAFNDLVRSFFKRALLDPEPDGRAARQERDRSM
ncbi:prolyl oligopeptidase family serine peptidase [Lysobacter firmicutimachus]|uniref:Prolyl oligopeptidase family serine peptidase n=1 Tax=Lysobacter firmicutimachus TaxID=1792846 RepID=A0AAU8MS95_9GAMM